MGDPVIATKTAIDREKKVLSGATTSSDHIECLAQRVAACENISGALSETNHKHTLSGRLQKLNKEVEEIFEKGGKELKDYEKGVATTEEWLESQHAKVSHVVLHKATKRQYLAQHASRLRDLAEVFREVKELEQFVIPTAEAKKSELLVGQLDFRDLAGHLPKFQSRLRAVECAVVPAVDETRMLHEHISKLASDYHNTIGKLNEQLLKWDNQLSKPYVPPHAHPM